MLWCVVLRCVVARCIGMRYVVCVTLALIVLCYRVAHRVMMCDYMLVCCDMVLLCVVLRMFRCCIALYIACMLCGVLYCITVYYVVA